MGIKEVLKSLIGKKQMEKHFWNSKGDLRKCRFETSFNIIGMPIIECLTHSNGEVYRLSDICKKRLKKDKRFQFKGERG